MSDAQPDPTRPVDPSDTDHLVHPPTTHGDPMTEPQPSTAPTTPFRVDPPAPVPDDAPQEWASHAPRAVHAPAPAASADPTPLPPPVAPQWQQPLVTIQKGPRPFTVMLGLLSMVVAGYVLTMNLTEADLDLRVIGPATFGAFGVLLVLVGLVGVVAGGRRRA